MGFHVDRASYDFFFAADVLVYLGDVRPLFATCRSLARPTTSTGAPAVFAFSTEAWMGESRRYMMLRWPEVVLVVIVHMCEPDLTFII